MRITWKKSLGVSFCMLLLLAGCATLLPPSGRPYIEKIVRITGYCSCGTCCSWTRNWYMAPVYSKGPHKGEIKHVGQTSSGKYAKVGTIAADTNVFPYGTIIYVEGYGYGRVEDTGEDIKGMRLDLFFKTHRAAQNWGTKTQRIKVWYP